MDFTKITLRFRDKAIRALYSRHEIKTSRKNMKLLSPLCILVAVANLLWSLLADHHLQSIISKLIFMCFAIWLFVALFYSK